MMISLTNSRGIGAAFRARLLIYTRVYKIVEDAGAPKNSRPIGPIVIKEPHYAIKIAIIGHTSIRETVARGQGEPPWDARVRA